MTPHELNIRVDIYNENRIDDAMEKMRLCIVTAHYTESFQRTKDLKNLSYYIEELENSYKTALNKKSSNEPKEQTQEQMLTQIQTLNSLFGGKIVYVTSEGVTEEQ